MTVFVVWSDAAIPAELDGASEGPWREVRRVDDRLLLVDSVDGLSRVYHAVKWELPDAAALIAVPVGDVPKLRYLPPGTQTWLRSRVGRDD